MKNKWLLLLLFSLLLGAFLRFYRLPENLIFHGELGHNYLAIKNAFENNTIPLLGPPTSHPWLSFGPLFYWLFGPMLALFRFNPLVGGYFFAVLGTGLILLNYFAVKKFFGEKAAAFSSFLIAVSPAWLKLTRDARFFSLAALFFYPFLYFLLRARLFWAGFFFGVMLNFHLSPLILIPAILIIIYTLKGPTLQGRLVRFVGGLIIPSTPFLIYNALSRFEMLKNLVLWIPYRALGFLGLVPKNNASQAIFQANFVSLFDFIGDFFVKEPGFIKWLFLLLILGFAGVSLIRRSGKKKNQPLWVLVLFLLFGYVGIFIHGDPPSHYYLPIYPIPIILLSVLIGRLKKTVFGFAVIFLVLLTIYNFRFYFSDSWFYLTEDKIRADESVPYSLQIAGVAALVKDANGQRYELHRVGPNDEFEGNYAQNFRFLAWRMGNEPVESAALKYTILETAESESGQTIYTKDGFSVVKEKNEEK